MSSGLSGDFLRGIKVHYKFLSYSVLLLLFNKYEKMQLTESVADKIEKKEFCATATGVRRINTNKMLQQIRK